MEVSRCHHGFWLELRKDGVTEVLGGVASGGGKQESYFGEEAVGFMSREFRGDAR